MKRPAYWLLVLLSPLVMLACSPEGVEFDRAALEQTEDLTESLANDMLGMSIAIREGDDDSIRKYFASSVSAPSFPVEPAEEKLLADLVTTKNWAVTDASTPQSHEQFLENLAEFFSSYSYLEDVRFKVKNNNLDEQVPRASAKLKFFVVGRDQDQQRKWLKGLAKIVAERRQPDSPWQIKSFEITELHSKSTRADLFSEVAAPAGIAVRFPRFGEGNNLGFVSHGAAVSDINGDGLLDIAATGVDQNYLYLNRGDGTFDDLSADSLVKFAPPGTGAVFLDFDNDGDSDLFFARVGKQVLFENRWVPDGEVKFWDISEQAGVDRGAVGFSALSADVNGDSYPDLYVTSYNHYGTVLPNSWVQATNGTPNLLLINNQNGTFTEAAQDWGLDDPRWSYAAQFIDIDGDGDQDLYVANDFGENGMYRNEGNRRFVNVAQEMGIVDSGFGMGVSFGDYDNDGDFDLHVTNMSSTAGQRILSLLYEEDDAIRAQLSKQAVGNSLYQNDGDGTFTDVTSDLGGLSGGWAFGGGFFDFDNDGREDIYSPNGFISGKSMKDT